MNIHFHDGCYGGYYTIDDKELEHFTEEEKQNLWLRLVNHLRMNPKMEELQELLSFVMNGYGTFECSEEPCDCCGHWSEDIDLKL